MMTLMMFVQELMRELPSEKRARFSSLGLSDYDVSLLTDDVATAEYFDGALAAGAPAKLAANWILSDLSKHCNVCTPILTPLSPRVCTVSGCWSFHTAEATSPCQWRKTTCRRAFRQVHYR